MKAVVKTGGAWAGMVIESPILPKCIHVLTDMAGQLHIEAYQRGVDGEYYFVGSHDKPQPAQPDQFANDPATGRWNSGRFRDVVPIDVGELLTVAKTQGVNELLICCIDHPGAPVVLRFDATEKVMMAACAICSNAVLKLRVQPPQAPAVTVTAFDDSAFFEAGVQRFGERFVKWLEQMKGATHGDHPSG